jgi:outer membrane protein insertion porin family
MNAPARVLTCIAVFIASCGVACAQQPEQQAPAKQTEATEAAPAAPQGPPIVAIEIQGNQRINQDIILPAISSRVGSPFSQETAQKDARAIYELGWFHSVEPSAVQEEKGVRLVFSVVENFVLKEIQFKDNVVMSREQLLEVMKTKPGQVLNNQYIRQDAAAIEEAYQKKGYAYARVLEMEVKEETGVLEIPVGEGTIEDIRVLGNGKTKTWVIKSKVRSKKGAALDTNVVRKDLQRLYNMDLFEDVSADPELGSRPGSLILNYRVKEKKTGLAAFGFGWSSVQKVVGFIDVSDSNFRGTAQRLSVRAEFGGRDSFEVGYFNPFMLPSETTMNLNLYNKVILRQAFTGSQSFLYDERRRGGNITLGRSLSDTRRVFATLRADDISASDERVASLQAESVRSVALAMLTDTRDIIFDPSRGSFTSYSVEVAGLLGGQADFSKWAVDLRRYFKAGRNKVFATRLMLGMTGGDPPPLEQFLVGGGESLRGYRNDRFPGERMALLNSELRFPLGKKLKGVVFFDVGDAWQGSFAQSFGDANFKGHIGYGIGVRVVTPIGPIRLDYGIGDFGPETHFSMGHVF